MNRGERWATFGGALSVLLMLAGIQISSHGLPNHGPIDIAAFVAFLFFTAWLMSSPVRGDDPAHHQETRNGIAFRLGKALNRILRPHKRSL